MSQTPFDDLPDGDVAGSSPDDQIADEAGENASVEADATAEEGDEQDVDLDGREAEDELAEEEDSGGEAEIEVREKFDPHVLSDMIAEDAVLLLISYAADMESSDLYLLTDENAVNISIRRLGMVQQVAYVSRDQGRSFISYVKAMAGMDISDHRRPREGRWLVELGEKRLDLRVSSIATLFGEDMTLRMWDRRIGLRCIDGLGMANKELSKLKNLLTRPSGLLLVTGPTGTGKSTTLYACLQYLNNGRRKINTLEDPIEYAINGIRQSRIYPKLEVDFAELLRNVLRQSPDVIMIGEIRDEETAVAAVRAANSGHLVLATLHAPIAAAAVHSMLALGSQPFFLSSCLLGVVAQRLIRTLCPKCHVRYDIDLSPQTFEGIQDLLDNGAGGAIYGPSPTGCDACYGMGYAGRTGLFEIMTMNREIRQHMGNLSSAKEIEEAAIANGMIEFRRGALLKVAMGVTSTEEIIRDVPAEYLGIEN